MVIEIFIKKKLCFGNNLYILCDKKNFVLSGSFDPKNLDGMPQQHDDAEEHCYIDWIIIKKAFFLW